MSRRTLETIGVALAAAGLLTFLVVPFLGQFEISPEALSGPVELGVASAEQRQVVLDELRTLAGERYRSVFRFVGDVGSAIGRANERLEGSALFSDYQRGLIELELARLAGLGAPATHSALLLLASITLAALGGLIHFVAPFAAREPAGVRNDGVFSSSTRSRGSIGIALGAALIGFYIALYFYPAYIISWIRLGDPVSQLLRGQVADRWFFYGLLYTLAILVMGTRMLVQYRHSRYHVVRTLSVMFFQFGFAFLIPAVLAALNQPEYDFKNAWPLDYSFFYSYRLDRYSTGGAFGWFILFWGIGLSVIVIPVLAYFFGKRWYCSWVCGCGGLAETLGDPFRHLSDKRLVAWRVERWLVHGVLVFAVAMTGIVIVNYLSGLDGHALLGNLTWRVQSWYGFLIGSIFAGVVGTGFYPLMGNRVWCRFGCPLAAILGIVQRYKSRFRITTNGGQCISCGNCSTYCEMGIDVRWYAQRGENVVRASCVGCGICAAVCPRGVLRLENGSQAGRLAGSGLLGIGGGGVGAAPTA